MQAKATVAKLGRREERAAGAQMVGAKVGAELARLGAEEGIAGAPLENAGVWEAIRRRRVGAWRDGVRRERHGGSGLRDARKERGRIVGVILIGRDGRELGGGSKGGAVIRLRRDGRGGEGGRVRGVLRRLVLVVKGRHGRALEKEGVRGRKRGSIVAPAGWG